MSTPATTSESTAAELIIIGGGIAGSAAALRAAQYGISTIWLRGDKQTHKRSRGQWVANVDNMLGVHDAIARKLILKELRGDEFAAARAQIEHKHAHIGTRELIGDVLDRLQDYPSVTIVEAAATGLQPAPGAAGTGAAGTGAAGAFEVEAGERRLSAPAVVLATGVMDRQPRIAKERGDEIIDDPRWIYPFANRETVLYCIRCEGHLTRKSCVAVLGHGRAAAELALMLHERYDSACSILTNGETPDFGERRTRLLKTYGVDVHTERIVDVSNREAGKKGELGGFELAGGVRVEVHFGLVALGLHRVYNDLARAAGAELADPESPADERHVLVNARGETSVPGLFAIGDMAKRLDEPIMKQIYTAQEYAVRAVDTVDSRRRDRLRASALGE